jgi:hypothetical protein
MLTGFNTNITYKGEVYHIQTEDSGLRNPVITTLLYKGGVILASKKTSYKDLLSDFERLSEDVKDKIKKLMAEQHRAMIEDLFKGKFDSIIKSTSTVKVTLQGGPSSNIREVTVKEQSQVLPSPPTEISKKETEATRHSERFKTLDEILLEHILKRKKV